MSTSSRFAGTLVLLCALVVAAPALAVAPPRRAPAAQTVIEAPPPVDGIGPEQEAAIEAALDRHQARQRAAGVALPKEEAPLRYPFFPQAGVMGRDLFLTNYTDLDPGTGILDFDCSEYTYDGHQGHDSLIRSFREQAIGVPVFAALPGMVIDTHDGEPDTNTVADAANLANYVFIDEGNGYAALYLHFRAGSVAVSPGDVVAAGTQLGLTGSSGFSNWPHLHFETRKDGRWVEPSAGPCRPGESLWSAPVPVMRDLYVADVYLSRDELSFPDDDSLLFDATTRAGSFLKGQHAFGIRVDLRNLPERASYTLRVRDPRGKVVYERTGNFSNPSLFRLAIVPFNVELDLASVGTWRVQLEVADSPMVDAPFRVVATSQQLANRKPNRITAKLTPAHPAAGDVRTCTVQTSLVNEDPDYDLVAYRYQWKVNNKVVRTVTSAALSDLLAADRARPQDKVSCTVTPSDVRSLGPAARAAAGEGR